MAFEFVHEALLNEYEPFSTPRVNFTATGAAGSDRASTSIAAHAGTAPTMGEDLRREYARRFGLTADYRRRIWSVLTSKFFAQWIPAEATVLDLGCGWGEFINQIAAARKYGMDLNPESKRKVAPEVSLLAQDCSERWPIDDAQLDVVFTSNFFEHLPTNESLQRTLSEAFRCLRSGGRIICMGPNVKHLPGRYWDFIDHRLPLTELSLKEGLELAGFRVEWLRAKFLPYSMSQGFTPPLVMLRLFLKLRFLWRIFGEQFLVLATKPARSS